MSWSSGFSLPGPGWRKPALPRHYIVTLALVLLALRAPGVPDDFAALCTDRTAVEQVYYSHRLGNKPPFEQLLPPATIQKLVRQNLQKEAILKKVYGIEITSVQIDAEVQRLNSTTRAPDILAGLKAALGNDPVRFARTVARPALVERELRIRFEDDDSLHALPRREIENVRAQLLAAKARGQSATNLLAWLRHNRTNEVSETTWQLGPRPEEPKASGPKAQILSSPETPGVQKGYFADLPEALQSVLRTQLHQAGDISAVIETSGGFLLYLCREKSTQTLDVAVLSLAKRSYEAWIAEQAGADDL